VNTLCIPLPTSGHQLFVPGKRSSQLFGRNRPDGENVVPTSGGHFHRSFHMLLAFDLAEIKFLFAGSCLGPTIGRANWFERSISAQKIHHLRNELAPYTSTPSTTAASAALSAGTIRVCRCRRLASKAIDKTPFTGRNWPESASSPLMQNESSAGNRLFSSSFSMPGWTSFSSISAPLTLARTGGHPVQGQCTRSRLTTWVYRSPSILSNR